MSTQVEAQTVVIPDFGNGRYSPLKREVWEDAQIIFKLSSEKAEKLAEAIARDLGAIMASAPVEVRLGKLNKDGKLTIREAAKIKNVTITNSLSALRALNYANDAGSMGFIRNTTDWNVGETLTNYFKTL